MLTKTDLSARVQPIRLESRGFLSVVGGATAVPRPAAPPLSQAGPAPDLARLPGAGPGLIWKLQAAGVDSLAALAAVDPSVLRREFGALAGLVDLDGWIAFARADKGRVG